MNNLFLVKDRVLVVDDHPLVRMGLVQLINQDPAFTVCGEAGAAVEVPGLVLSEDPDLMVLDLTLSDGSGLGVLREVLRLAPHLGVLVVSMLDARVYAERCRQSGARGYVAKEEAPATVVSALRAISGGGTWFPDAMVGSDKPTASNLSPRELEVFDLIGRGLPTRAIAEKLTLSDKTVEAHKANLKKKLGVQHAAELVKLAFSWRDGGA
jgi:DNA-binding NarL/FixJ family response regulator